MGKALHTPVDFPDLRRQFAASGRIQVPNVFDHEFSRGVLASLEHDVAWDLAFIDEGVSRTMTPAELEKISAEERARLNQRIFSRAAQNFQYVYCKYPIVKALNQGTLHSPALQEIVKYIDSGEFIDYVKAITGIDDIVRTNLMAARYSRGHFLTRHNDSQDKDRRVAYVFNFTEQWSPVWGGLLHFMDDDMKVADTYVPEFNSLVLFAVPAHHFVSFVTPFAKRSRYTITGWLTV